MADIKELATRTVIDCYHAYFVNKDSDFIIKRCDNMASVIGLDRPVWDCELIIVNEQQQVDVFSENTCLVKIRACVRDVTYNVQGDRYFVGTFLCRLVKGEIRFLSVHLSEDNGSLIQTASTKYSDEYYKRALNYMYDVVFEYDSFNKTFTYDYVKYRELFEVDTLFVSMDQWFWSMCTECLHPEDTELLDIFRSNDIGKRLKNDDCVVDACIRIKNSEKGYIWVNMVVIFIPNKARNNIEKLFAMFKNIDNQKRKEIKLMNRARIDYLTNLYNKEYTEEKINEYLKNTVNKRGAYVVFDICEFKKINDIYGHIAGNEILVNVAKRISDNVSEDDIVGRIGGDEIGVFFKGCSSKNAAKEKADKLLEAIEYEYFEDDIATNITCNVGISMYSLENMTAEDLYKTAVADLDENKRNGNK